MATLQEAIEALDAADAGDLYQLAVAQGYGAALLGKLRGLMAGAGAAIGWRTGVESLTEQIDTLARQRDLALEGRAWVVANAPASPQKAAVLGAIDIVTAEWGRRISHLTEKRQELQLLLGSVS